MKSFKNTTLLFLTLSFSFSLTNSSLAQNTGGGNTGIGVMLGEPTGISLKIWNNERTAIDAGLAWSFSGRDAVHLHADYLLHKWLDIEKGNLVFYYGFGGRIAFSEDPFIGARIPLGLNYLIPESPLELFAEVVPILDILPDTEFDANGAVGLRFYF